MSGSLGSLVFELQANLLKTQEDMGKLEKTVGDSMARIDQAATRTSRNIQSVARAGASIGRVGGAEQAANDLDKVGHSAVGARREMLVLAHELATGNFKRAAGSVMVLAERMDWMTAIMSPAGAAIGAVAIAAIGLAAAYIHGAQQSREFAESIVLTGNYAGLTEGRFREMSQGVANSANVTIGTANDITQALVQTGRFGSESLQHVAMAAAMFADVSGEKAEDVVKNFARMSEGPLKFALDLDKTTHFMTGALYDQVKALDDAGKKEEAMTVVSDAVTAALVRQGYAVDNDGLSWKGFKEWVSGAVDSLSKFLGGADTATDRISRLRNELQSLESSKANAAPGLGGAYDSRIDDVKAQLGAANALNRNQTDNADLTAARRAHDSQVVEAKQYWSHLLETTKTGAETLKQEQDEIQRQGILAGASQADIDAEKARVAKGFNHGGAGVASADLSSQTKPIQDGISAQEKLLSDREKVLSQYYRDNLIGEQGYYDTSATVIQAYNKVVSDLYDQEIAIVERAAQRSTDAKNKIELTTKANALRDDKQTALLESSERLSSLTVQQTQDTEKYRNEVEQLASQLDKLNHTQSQSAGADFDRQHASLRKQATANGDTGTLDTLAQARDAEVAQAQINALKEQGAQIEKTLALNEEATNLAAQSGAKGQIAAELELGQMRAAASAQLEQIAAKMQQIAAASGHVEFTNQAQEFQNNAQQLQQSSNVVGNSISGVFQDQFAKVLDNAITRTKTLKQEFASMAQSIEDSIEQIVSKDLANQLFGNIGSAGGGNNGSGGVIGSLIGMVMGFFGGETNTLDGDTPDDLIAAFNGAPGMFSGGLASAGGLYQVAENGPELLSVANKSYLMMGDRGGSITPASGGGASGGNTYHLNISVPPGTTRASSQQQARAIMSQAQIAQGRNS